MSETRARDTANVATELVDIAIDVVNLDASKLDLAGGKILQIVRATDSTDRSTTSTSFVDASISVTITPQKSDSAILVVWSVLLRNSNANSNTNIQITDNSNNALSGSEIAVFTSSQNNAPILFTTIGYSTPATTSATIYKGRFSASADTSTLLNASNTGQLYAIEVSA